MSTQYDAVVIGTGAGGAAVIHKFVEAGMRVLAVEKGRRLELSDIYEGGVFGHPFSSNGRGDEIKFIRNRFLQQNLRRDLPKAEREIRYIRYSHHGEPEPAQPAPTSDGWMSQLVGGGTVHYGGASFRMDPVDLRMQSTFGKEVRLPSLPEEHQADLADWPMEWSELERWYDEAERLIGIAGAPGSGLPALRMNKAEKHVAQALKAAGHRAQVINAPMAINSGKHGGRPACRHSGLCQDFACRFEAKSDMRVTLLRDAEKTGLLTILPLAFVRRLEVAGGRVTGVETVVQRQGGPKVETFAAPIVVVACEVVETIRLLLASGVGNADVLGRYVMYHVTGGARSISPVPTTTWDNAPHTGYIRSYYNERSSGANPFVKAGILQFSTVGGPLQVTDGTYAFGQQRRRAWGPRAHGLRGGIPLQARLQLHRRGLPHRVQQGRPHRLERDGSLRHARHRHLLPPTPYGPCGGPAHGGRVKGNPPSCRRDGRRRRTGAAEAVPLEGDDRQEAVPRRRRLPVRRGSRPVRAGPGVQGARDREPLGGGRLLHADR